MDEMREKIAQVEFCQQNCLSLYSACQHSKKGCQAIFLQEKKQNGWPFVMADQILSLETNGYTLEEMILFFSKINRDTEREVEVRKEAELPTRPKLKDTGYVFSSEEDAYGQGYYDAQRDMIEHGWVKEAQR